MSTRRAASYHILVVGEDLAGLAYAALAARAGYRVGVIGQDTTRGTYALQGHVLPREPERIIGFETSPVINAVFRDLSMGMEMRNLPRPVDPILQYVRPDSRLEVNRDFDRWMSELGREFSDEGRTMRQFESWAAQASRDTDALVSGDTVLPTAGMRGQSRYEKAMSDQQAFIEGQAPEGVAPLDVVRDEGAARGLVMGALGHLTTLRPRPLAPLTIARLWTQLKSGLTTVPGGADVRLSSGFEDYYLSGQYFDAGAFASPLSGMTAENRWLEPSRLVAYRLHEADPVVFERSLVLRWQNGMYANGSLAANETHLQSLVLAYV